MIFPLLNGNRSQTNTQVNIFVNPQSKDFSFSKKKKKFLSSKAYSKSRPSLLYDIRGQTRAENDSWTLSTSKLSLVLRPLFVPNGVVRVKVGRYIPICVAVIFRNVHCVVEIFKARLKSVALEFCGMFCKAKAAGRASTVTCGRLRHKTVVLNRKIPRSMSIRPVMLPSQG